MSYFGRDLPTITVATIFLAALLGVYMYLSTGTGKCEALMQEARTKSDTLIVYGMKPNSQYTTCYDRLTK